MPVKIYSSNDEIALAISSASVVGESISVGEFSEWFADPSRPRLATLALYGRQTDSGIPPRPKAPAPWLRQGDKLPTDISG